jgi:aspartate racemase
MKTIGLIGGITWLSTADYYRVLNEMTNERLGGVASAKIVLYSVNFEEIKTLTFANDWKGISRQICEAAIKLEAAGADCLLICANTMHKIADEVQQAVHIPIIHVAEQTGKTIQEKQLKKIALLGTRYTMELGFYPAKLRALGIETIIPDEADRQYIHDAIYNEMGKGIFLPATKERFLTIIQKMSLAGAEGIVLGCTEIPLLIKQTDCSLPVFDTTFIHAKAAVDFSLK